MKTSIGANQVVNLLKSISNNVREDRLVNSFFELIDQLKERIVLSNAIFGGVVDYV